MSFDRELLLEVLAESKRLGFLGPAPLDRQLDHSLALVSAVLAALRWPPERPVGPAPPEPADRADTPEPPSLDGPVGAPARPTLAVADLGSGGGLPGLVVAASVSGAEVSLIESQDRRAQFLGRALARLGLDRRSRVLHERAEVVGRAPEHRAAFDVVTARSFGPPAVTAECAAPLLRVGGLLVAADAPAREGGEAGDAGAEGGVSAAAPARWPPDELALLGMAGPTTVAGAYRFQVLRQAARCPDRYPRRVGVPRKRPLF